VILEIVKTKYNIMTSPMQKVVIGFGLLTMVDRKSPVEANRKFNKRV
jgi:hypothetical protein